jgi:hypothetical protein
MIGRSGEHSKRLNSPLPWEAGGLLPALSSVRQLTEPGEGSLALRFGNRPDLERTAEILRFAQNDMRR